LITGQVQRAVVTEVLGSFLSGSLPGEVVKHAQELVELLTREVRGTCSGLD
jgi:hypothetical protein